MKDEAKRACLICGKTKPASDFGWSKRKKRPTKACKMCWGEAGMARSHGNESTEELLLYYAHIRRLVEEINTEIASGKTIADIWVAQMTEEAYTSIVQALIGKASAGDVNAAKLLLEERHRRLGEPTPDSTAESFELLFKTDPLTPNLDTE